ncbi:unnamed protein product [Prorocentrum cordatum]|uniref:Uncharacterized protein n=1 Tax=Prorocentrum cordatum TaxID=2364126 RepID=A0ABN9U535_9DINO|nr:unnamed protein product [Polarella glacialis]
MEFAATDMLQANISLDKAALHRAEADLWKRRHAQAEARDDASQTLLAQTQAEKDNAISQLRAAHQGEISRTLQECSEVIAQHDAEVQRLRSRCRGASAAASLPPAAGGRLRRRARAGAAAALHLSACSAQPLLGVAARAEQFVGVDVLVSVQERLQRSDFQNGVSSDSVGGRGAVVQVDVWRRPRRTVSHLPSSLARARDSGEAESEQQQSRHCCPRSAAPSVLFVLRILLGVGVLPLVDGAHLRLVDVLVPALVVEAVLRLVVVLEPALELFVRPPTAP